MHYLLKIYLNFRVTLIFAHHFLRTWPFARDQFLRTFKKARAALESRVMIEWRKSWINKVSQTTFICFFPWCWATLKLYKEVANGTKAKPRKTHQRRKDPCIWVKVTRIVPIFAFKNLIFAYFLKRIFWAHLIFVKRRKWRCVQSELQGRPGGRGARAPSTFLLSNFFLLTASY